MMRLRNLFVIGLGATALAGCAARSISSITPESKKKSVRFLHLGDMHAQLETHWEYLPEDPSKLHRMGGFARVKTAIDQLRASAPAGTFVVDGGDTFQGSGPAAWTEGRAVLKPLNALGIDVGIPGNWEVVYGPQVFRELMGQVNYKVLAYNFQDVKSGARLFAPATVIEKDGVRVAFIGQTDITTTVRQPPAQVKGLDSTKSAGLREFILDLKLKAKPDLVVLVDHNGLTPMVQLAQQVPEIDIILSNHTHERVYAPIRVGKTVIVEPGSMGSFLGKLDVTLENGKVSDVMYDLVQIREESFSENESVKALVDQELKPFRERLKRIIGKTDIPLMRYDVLESNLDNLVADAARAATRSDIAFTNGFRFSPPIPAGPITEGDLWNVLPLDADLKVGTVTGKQVWDYLEKEMELVFSKNPEKLSGGWGPRPSGMTIKFVAGAPEGQRIKSVHIGGKPLDRRKVYVVGGCDREGEPLETVCRIRDVKDVRMVPGSAHSALADYIRKNSPLNGKREGRVRAEDLPDSVWSQYGLLQRMWSLPGQASAVMVPR